MRNSSNPCLNKSRLNFYFLQLELKLPLSYQVADLIIVTWNLVVTHFYFYWTILSSNSHLHDCSYFHINVMYVFLHFCLSHVSFTDPYNRFGRQLSVARVKGWFGLGTYTVPTWVLCSCKLKCFSRVSLDPKSSVQSTPRFFQRYRRNGKNSSQLKKNNKNTKKITLLEYLLKGIKNLLKLEIGIFTCMYKSY